MATSAPSALQKAHGHRQDPGPLKAGEAQQVKFSQKGSIMFFSQCWRNAQMTITGKRSIKPSHSKPKCQ